MTLSPLLVDAKKEYTHQLADLLAPYVMTTLARMFEKANKNQKTFREMLRQVPNWNATIIDERTHEIERRNPQLADLIAACCVSYTKVLGSIKLNHSQSSNVRISLPHSNTFVHGVYIHVAKEYYYEPKMLYADRHAKMNLMHDAVEESIRQHVPIQQLLKAYLSTAVDEQGIDPIAASMEMDGSPQQASMPGTPIHPGPALNDVDLMQQLQQLQMQQQQQQMPVMMQPAQMPVMVQQPQPQIPVMMQPVVHTHSPQQLGTQQVQQHVMPIMVPQEPAMDVRPMDVSPQMQLPLQQQQEQQQQPEFFDDVADFH